ncbi:MAG: aminoglycoside phosphotransferase family protein [Chloroflexota bacterium]|nr:aminoglycoside phosphotransferase family protein [Chloroflexota bacterium]
MPVVPDDFARATIRRSGASGRDWLARLPMILDDCAARWGLTLGAPATPLSFNYVVAVRRTDGMAAILKVHVPNDGFASEVAALQLFNGRGIARLLASDPHDEALLVERCTPGRPLSSLTVADDERATSIAASVMQQVWRPLPPDPDYSFATMTAWNADLRSLRPHYGGGTGPFPRALIEEVERLVPALTASAPSPILLHGDLHYDNILAAERQPWLAIDPKGLAGEPAYETGALLYNPRPHLLAAPYPGRILARRVDQLAEELRLDHARVRGWGLVRAVLSAWWNVQSTGQIREEALICAGLLAAL